MIDTHAHINTSRFNYDYDTVIEDALANGIEIIIVVGFDTETIKRAVELAEKYENIYATVGWHPVDAKYIKEEDWIFIEKMIRHEKVVAIGECGLDYYWDTSSKEEQIPVFKRHIELAKKYNKPLVIHTRDAIQETYNILKQHDISNCRGVMHCFTGSAEMALKFIDLGLYISLGGPVTFKNASKPKNVAKVVPLENLLLETDCPYLTPHPHRGKRNEPKYVKLIAEEISRIKNVDFDIVDKTTTQNALKLFQINNRL